MVHVTKTNFLAQLTDFLHHLPNASFVAIDEEMTGINLPPTKTTNSNGGNSREQQRFNKIELPGERYTRRWKGVPERYSILQVGVALFHKNPNYRKESKEVRSGSVVGGGDGADSGDGGDGGDNNQQRSSSSENNNEDDDEHAFIDDDDDNTAAGDDTTIEDEQQSEYTSRIYNFYLFPDGRKSTPEREVTLNPSAVKFLLENHMDFDKVFREGITFTTVERAAYLKKRYFERYDTQNEEGLNGTKVNASGGGGGANNTPNKGGSNTPSKNRVKLSRVEDIAFVARTMAGLREWIDSDNSAQNPLAEEGIAAPPVAADATDDATTNGETTTTSDTANGSCANNNNTANPNPNKTTTPHEPEGTSLVLPPCNAFLRRCLYETIEDEYPGLVLERASSDPSAGPARNQIRATRLSPAEKSRRERRLRRENWDRMLLHDVGFAVVFRAMSDACNGRVFSAEQTRRFLDGLSPELSMPAKAQDGEGRKIPLVIHNGLHDLMFLLTHCHNARLPESFEDTKKVIRGYFPVVYDTKILGTEYSDAIIKSGHSALGDLFDTTCNTSDANSDVPSLKAPLIVNQDGRSQGQAHEAAWDAYMTGCVFNALCNRILESKNRFSADLTLDDLLHESADGMLREWIGLNKIYMHVSLYTIDLESSGPAPGMHDPLSSGLSVDTTFRISGITTSVSTRDILQALTTGNESEEEAIRELRYEIIWVDDTSFFVGTRMTDCVSEDDADATGLVASHVRSKLHAGLGGDVEILPLGEYFKKKHEDVTETMMSTTSETGGIVDSLVWVAMSPLKILGRAFSYGKRSSEDDGNIESAKKPRKSR